MAGTEREKRWRIAAVNFDHIHMGDLLREVHDHPGAEIAGICDASPERMADAIRNFAIPRERVHTDVAACLAAAEPDIVIICPKTADHARVVEEVAPSGAAILVEKPFAASLADADRMIAATRASGSRLAINWPLAWYPAHVTAKRLVEEGVVGDVLEVHFYDGNRGPLYHLADKVEVSDEEVIAQKPGSWWYRRESGGGSLLDYLGYGATLGTWFMNGRAPLTVTSVVDRPAGLEVDEHSITVLRYDTGLSKMETRWGTFTDPWTMQPQPKCGFVIVGSEGTISSYDFEHHVHIQTRRNPTIHPIPVRELTAPHRKPVEYVIARWSAGLDVEGPLSPTLSRIGQQIVDTARLSADLGRTLELLP